MANYSPFQGYSVFDSLMRESIRRQYSKSKTPTTVVPSKGTGMTGLGIGSATTTGPATSPYATSQLDYVESETQGVMQANLAALEDPTAKKISRGEAAVKSATPYGLRAFGRTGRVAQSVATALMPDPTGVFSGLMGGKKTVDPYGRPAVMPGGILGLAASRNIEKQYEVFDKIQAKTPGYHQFYSGNQLVSIVPQEIAGQKLGYAVLGTTSLTNEQAIAQYATAYGFDPATVDLSLTPSNMAFGTELEGFVPGVGGIGVDGQFVDAFGNRSAQPKDPMAYLGIVNEVYGPQKAMQIATDFGIDATASGGAGVGSLKEYKDAKGDTIGYGTGTGGYVTNKDGQPVKSGTGGYAYFGTGAISKEQLDAMRSEGEGDSRPDTEEETSVDQSPSVGIGEQDTAYAATGGMISRTQMQEGGEVPPGEAPVAAEAGFVEQEPENLPEGMTVADDVPVEVPEGTFVLNAAAVEFMGSADVKKMILDAIAEAEKQGLDIKQENNTIPKESLISLVVSRGEVIIPPQLAQIIGYDRLNKINNRGKAEVERRIEENGQAEQPQQAPTQEPPIAAATGGIIDLNKIKNYRDIKNPQASFLNTLETLGGFMTGSIDEMEKAVSYSGQYRQLHNLEDYYEDTMRHTLLGGMYPDTAAMYADAKEYYHTFVEGYGKIGYEKGKELLGLGESDQEQIGIANKIITESAVDLNNNRFGRELRKVVPDEQEYIRTVERMMDIARTEGIDKVPALRTEDGEEIRLQLSTVGR